MQYGFRRLLACCAVGGLLVSAFTACDLLSPRYPDGTLHFPAAIEAMFPGMEDTVLAFVGPERVPPRDAVWSSSDPTVVSVAEGGNVQAGDLGEAWIRLRYGPHIDSLRIRVIEPPDGQIAFVGATHWARTGQTTRHVWLMNADGTNLRKIWSPDDPQPGRYGTSSNPYIAPDGCAVVFQGNQPNVDYPYLWVKDLRTGAVRRLTSRPSGPPAWSPRGDRVAYTGVAGGRFIVLSIQTDGFDEVRHGDIEHGVAFSLDYMPDGERLVVTVMVPTEEQPRVSTLGVLDLYSGHVDTVSNIAPGPVGFPAVASDGRIAYNRGRDIHVLHADGRIEHVIGGGYSPPLRGAPEGRGAVASNPAFSPDGDWIAFEWVYRHYEVGTKGLSTVYVMRADGSDPVRLTHLWSSDVPTWGPICPDAVI